MKIKFHYCAVFILFQLIIANSFGQKDTIITRIIEFDEQGSVVHQDRHREYYRNIIKINPLLFVHGDIPLYFERTLNSKFSTELGFGFTYRDYWNEFRDDNLYSGIEPDRIKHVSRPSFKLGIRYYPSGFAPEEGYLALEYAYRAYTDEITTLDNNGEYSDEIVEQERIFNEYKIIFGGQTTFNYSNNLFWDYYIGFGARVKDFTEVKEENDFFGGQFNYTYTFDKDVSVVPAFYWGFKLGIAF